MPQRRAGKKKLGKELLKITESQGKRKKLVGEVSGDPDAVPQLPKQGMTGPIVTPDPNKPTKYPKVPSTRAPSRHAWERKVVATAPEVRRNALKGGPGRR